jgi:hypothetical protein
VVTAEGDELDELILLATELDELEGLLLPPLPPPQARSSALEKSARLRVETFMSGFLLNTS